jgi:hypothetical protein
MHVYEVRPCKDKRGFDLISDALAFGGCGISKFQMQSDTRSFIAAHMML